MEKQERFISLRLDDGLIGDLRKLSEKLSLGRSATVRLALNELVAKHIRPGHQGKVTVLETKFLNTILTNLGNRIFELENPEAGKYQEAIEAGKEVDKLLKEGKRDEANKLLRKREKKGLYTSSEFAWLESKETQ